MVIYWDKGKTTGKSDEGNRIRWQTDVTPHSVMPCFNSIQLSHWTCNDNKNSVQFSNTYWLRNHRDWCRWQGEKRKLLGDLMKWNSFGILLLLLLLIFADIITINAWQKCWWNFCYISNWFHRSANDFMEFHLCCWQQSDIETDKFDDFNSIVG